MRVCGVVKEPSKMEQRAKNVTFQQERLYDETEIRGALLAQYLRKEPSEKDFSYSRVCMVRTL